MKMEDRRPRATRFESDNPEARLARLRDQAPTLESSRRLRLYAIFGSVLVLLTIAAFYMTTQIYKALTEPEKPPVMIEVDKAPAIVESETEKALQRIEEEVAESDRIFAEQLEELKAVDLLTEEESSPAPDSAP